MKLKWQLGQWVFSCGIFRYTEVLAVVILHTLCAALVHDLEKAFLRSTVDCSDVAPNAHGHCPRGLLAVEGRCDPEPSKRWSGSERCSSAAFVMNKGVHRAGHLEMAHLLGHFIALFCIGPLIDVWGRKPVILVSILGDIVQMALFTLVASLLSDGIMAVLLPAVVTSGATNAFHPAVNAMVADLSKATVSGRANSYSTLKVVHCLSNMAGFGIGFGVLGMHLTDYYLVWTSISAVLALQLVLASLVLRETMSEDPPERAASMKLFEDPEKITGREGRSKSAVCRRGWRMMREVTRLVRGDRFLLNFISVQFFKVAAMGIAEAVTRPFLISHLGYPQQYASLAGLAVNMVALLGNVGSRVLLRRFGPLLVFGGSLVILVVGFCIMGFAGLAVSHQHSSHIFWAGLMLASLAFGVSDTSATVLLSLRVQREAMGVMFSLDHALGLAGHLVGVFLATRYLFNAKARGWGKSSCFTCCSIFVLVSALWYFVAYCVLAAKEELVDETDSDWGSSSDDESIGSSDSSEH